MIRIQDHALKYWNPYHLTLVEAHGLFLQHLANALVVLLAEQHQFTTLLVLQRLYHLLLLLLLIPERLEY